LGYKNSDNASALSQFVKADQKWLKLRYSISFCKRINSLIHDTG